MNYRFIIMETSSIEAFQKELIQEYEKRLSRYCKTKWIRVKKEKELVKQWKENNYCIGIFPGRSQISSVDLADKLNQLGINGNSNIDFYLCPDEKKLEIPPGFHETLSVSPMEFPPALTAGILYEQLYRAYRIINKEPYHK